MSKTVVWAATLSSGEEAVEEIGEWTVRPNERSPWVRLTQFTAQEGLHLVSLRVKVGNRIVNMPSLKPDKFPYLKDIKPLFYSLNYYLEVDEVFGANKESHYVDLVSHYQDFVVHFIQNTNTEEEGWIVITDTAEPPLAPSPLNPQKNGQTIPE